jgi:hypothetical protein
MTVKDLFIEYFRVIQGVNPNF